MRRINGKERKGGREKGTPNKRTGVLMDSLDCLNFDIVTELHSIYVKLGALDVFSEQSQIARLQAQAGILTELMTYVFPKRKSLDITHTVEQNAHIIWDFRHGDSTPDDIIAEANPAPITDRSIPEKI